MTLNKFFSYIEAYEKTELVDNIFNYLRAC